MFKDQYASKQLLKFYKQVRKSGYLQFLKVAYCFVLFINASYEMARFSLKLILLSLFLAVGYGCSEEGERSSADDQPRGTAIAGYEMTPINLSRIIRASSRVEPENVITIASRMEGLITSLNVREGDEVAEGDVILTFDVDERRAELDRAKAELELASARYDRNKQLLDREAISASEYEESRAELLMAENDVKLRETRVRFGTVRAPDNMVIMRRFVEKGDAVSTNEPLFRGADLNRLVVRLGIPERDVVHLSRGQQANVRIDAFPDRTFEGTVRRIFPAADDESRLITVEVSLDAEQKDLLIQPGFLARISLDAEQLDGVLAVPSESLLASGRNERFVYVINSEDRLERRDVVTGTERRNWTRILEGLETGDIIVGANPSNLREDLLVNVTRWVENEETQVAERR